MSTSPLASLLVADQPASPNRIVLRCKSSAGQCNLELTATSTVNDLAAFVVAQTGLSRGGLSLHHGYPPKRIDMSPEGASKTLAELNITSGENITAAGTISTDVNPTDSPSTFPSSAPSKATQLIRKIAPSDNCCLFTSVAFCTANANGLLSMEAPVVTDRNGVLETRMIIASIVLSDPEAFNEGILGMPPDDYAYSIMEPDRWGGGIEVAVLSAVHKVEIDVVDVLSGRIDRFGEDKAYDGRILLLYDGIHYDPLAMQHLDVGTLQTVFPISQVAVLAEAQALAFEAKQFGQYTDLTSCNLTCSICRTPLMGQRGAQEHAKSTGHAEFQERVAD